MASGPHYIVNSPASGTEYFAGMGYGCIPNNGTTITVTVKAWSGANATGSLVQVTTLLADAYDQTSSTSHTFSGNFNTVNASTSGTNGTDWFKPAGKFTGAQSVGSLEIWVSSYTGTAFIPSAPTFSPSNGNINDTITLTGSHFTDATSVTFNGVGASFTITNDTTISATVPAGATTGPIVVSNPNGSGTSATNFVVNGSNVAVYAYDGTTQQQVTAIYAFDGSAWQQITGLYAFDGTTWQQVV